jgi:hypothetical protein
LAKGKETELTRYAESRAQAEGWKVKKPEPTDPELSGRGRCVGAGDGALDLDLVEEVADLFSAGDGLAQAEGWKVKKPEPTDPELARAEIQQRLAANAEKASGRATARWTWISSRRSPICSPPGTASTRKSR